LALYHFPVFFQTRIYTDLHRFDFDQIPSITNSMKSYDIDHTQSDATLDFDVAKDLVEYIESNLALGHFLRFEKNIIELIPAEQVDTIINDLERIDNVSWRDIEYDEKVAKIVDKIIVVPKKIACSAAIFFPHRSWQKEVVGTASSYWSTLSQKLVAEGY